MLSDSLSVLKSIANCKCDHPLSVDLFNLYLKFICDNKEIVFAWGLLGKLVTWGFIPAFLVKSSGSLENLSTSGYPTRCLTLYSQC